MKTDRKGIPKEMKELGIERRNQLSFVTAKTIAQKMKKSLMEKFFFCAVDNKILFSLHSLKKKRLEGKSYDILNNA